MAAKQAKGAPTPEPEPQVQLGGTDEPVPATPGPPEGAQGDFYLGTYRTKEEAERGLNEKEKMISTLTSDRDRAAQGVQRLQRVVDHYIVTPPVGPGAATPHIPGYSVPVAPGVGYPTYPGHPAAGAPPVTPIPEITLRDPVDDPKGFREDMGKLLTSFGQNVAAQASQAVLGQIAALANERQRISALWEYFQSMNPDLAEHGEQVGESFTRIYGGRIPQDVHGMMTTLANDVRARVTITPKADAPPAEGRTEGIPAGGAAPKPAAAVTPAPRTTMTGEVKELQRKSGFF